MPKLPCGATPNEGRLSGAGWQGTYKRYDTPEAARVLEAAARIAKARGKTLAQVALAWVLDHPEVTSVILGASTVEQLDENLGGAGWTLAREEREALDKVSDLPMESSQYVAW